MQNYNFVEVHRDGSTSIPDSIYLDWRGGEINWCWTTVCREEARGQASETGNWPNVNIQEGLAPSGVKLECISTSWTLSCSFSSGKPSRVEGLSEGRDNLIPHPQVTALLCLRLQHTSHTESEKHPFDSYHCETGDYQEKVLRVGSVGRYATRFQWVWNETSSHMRLLGVESFELPIFTVSYLLKCKYPHLKKTSLEIDLHHMFHTIPSGLGKIIKCWSLVINNRSHGGGEGLHHSICMGADQQSAVPGTPRG